MPAGAAAKAEQKDIFHLSRFIDAQKGVYPTALAELQAGRKRTHWMWFIFPQLAGLGRSSTAQHFALSGQAEALAFLGHSCLGQRLVAATQAVMDQEEDLSAREIFSTPDDLKFLSSMTLFATLSETAGLDASLFRSAIRKFYDGKPDLVTIELLKQLP
ncbi:hypothetical protein BJF93_07000 [Xaviernesmea oryzae]|uniref:Calpastatin n=1 Tax=Xaviernesmea oryzae TaxID=464029 RepID=A0A1Q9ASH0_9HYPH|nr:DUF1810 domain-containing protein [Xaviernesmea oryzae]OLP58402.1 hypothetical protein BJF93_07000 [Xaviernesmea oryzae]